MAFWLWLKKQNKKTQYFSAIMYPDIQFDVPCKQLNLGS